MSEWITVKLGDIAKLRNGYAFKSADFLDDGVPVIKIKNVKSNRIVLDNLSYVSETTAKAFLKHEVQSDEILITMSGNRADGSPESWVGKAARFRVAGRFLLNQRVSAIKVWEEKANVDYLAYYLSSWETQLLLINQANSSGGQANISPETVREIEIDLPPLPEQEAIANVLTTLDGKIDLLHRQNKTLEAMAETLFRQWFVEEAHDGWELTSFETHFEVARGLSYKGAGLEEVGLGVPMHNLNSVFEGGGYKESGIKFYSGDYKQKHLVAPGDVIVANTEQGHDYRLIGFPAIIPSSFGEVGIFSQHIYRVNPKTSSYLSREFLYYLIMTPDVREQIIAATNGSTVNMLAIDGLSRPTFRLPPKKKVGQFSKTAKSFRIKIESNLANVRTLEKFRDTLLPKLMSGEVRVKT